MEFSFCKGEALGLKLLLVSLISVLVIGYVGIRMRYEKVVDERCSRAEIVAKNYYNNNLNPDSLTSKSSVDCNPNSWRIFYMDDNSILRRYPGNKDFWNTSFCCYTPYTRSENSYRHFLVASTCYPITNDETKLPQGVEFINVKCYIKNEINPSDDEEEMFYLDFFAAVPLKVDTETRIQNNENLSKSRSVLNENINIVILGLDFKYFSPLADNYIMSSLSGIKFHKFRRVGDSYHENMLALHMGLTTTEFKKYCFSYNNELMGKCALIWNSFADNGFRTSFAENIHHHQNNHFWEDPAYEMLQKRPTDYDLRMLLNLLEKVKVGKDKTHYCKGYRPNSQAILDNIVRTANTFKNKKYFQFSWISSSSKLEDDDGQSKYIGTSIIEVFKKLKKIPAFNETVFILLADNEMKYGPPKNDHYHRRTHTRVNKYKLPHFYMILPYWFSLKYPKAMSNLQGNANKLNSVFDAYETIKDLADLDTITDGAILNRESNIEEINQRRGISLFLPLDNERTCHQAGIPQKNCFCRKLPWSKMF